MTKNMNFKIISIGKKNPPEVEEFVEGYIERLKGQHNFSWVFAPSEALTSEDEKGKKKEAEKILSHIKEKSFVILFDEKGKRYTSETFSTLLQKTIENSFDEIVFIIGGAFGVSKEVKACAGEIISLSDFTFPHLLVRMVVVEQIYRAVSILNGSKYHHR